MIKENKGKLIMTSVVILLPVLVGLILWNALPDKVPTHWNAKNVIDGWSSKSFAVFAIPGFLLACHWLCILASATDPKKRNHSGKILGLVFWTCPVIAILMMVLVYGTAFGMKFELDRIMPVFMGFMFVVIGNYLPKCKQNYTIGIKIPWTLNDEENWNYTHRLGGRCWVTGGLAVMLGSLLPTGFGFALIIIVMVLLVIIPMLGSYMFYRKKTGSGE